MSIFTVDAGHSGSNYNKGAVPGYFESAIMWDLSQRFAKALLAHGHAVRMTRTDLDDDPGLVLRGEIAKGTRAFTSFHSNAEKTGSADYPMGIYLVPDHCGPIDEESKELARVMSNTVAEVMGTRQPARIWTRSSEHDRDGNGYNDDYYGVLRGCHNVGVPGIILECGFHTHPETAAWLMVEDNRQELAEALAKTMADFYGHKTSGGSASSYGSKTGVTTIVLRTLREGDTGLDVKFLQRFLLGYGGKPGAIIKETGGADGKYYSGTKRAVEAFQAENVDEYGKPLEEDGKCGPLTWGAIHGKGR